MKGDDDSRGPRPRRGPVPSTIQRRGAHQYLLYRGPGLVATALGIMQKIFLVIVDMHNLTKSLLLTIVLTV